MADRRVSVNVDADVSAFVRGMLTASAAAKGFGTGLKANEPLLVSQQKQLDRFSGRVALLGEAIATIGPAFIPLGAAATQALGGLSAGLLAAGTAAGTAILAFQGVGDGLKALNDYQLEPTAAHLEKVEQAFQKLGPAGEDFVLYLDSIGGQLKGVQNLARAGMFPGFEEGIDSMLTLLPQVRQIVRSVATELGDLAADAGKALAGDRWTPFFDYIQTDAAPTMRLFAEATGNVAEGLGNLLVAFQPLNRDFTVGLADMTQRFADWAASVSQTQGFQEFVDYLRQSGPQAIEFLGAISNALVGIVTAAAPFGQTVLPILTSLADILATIASSPVGPPLFTAAAGFIALNRAVTTFGPGLTKINEAFLDLRTSPNVAATAAERFGSALRGITGAAGVGLFVTSLGETNDKLKAFEGIAGGALTGLAVGGPWGAAIGAGVGALTLFGDTTQENTAYIDALTASLDKQTGAFTANSRAVAAKTLEDQGILQTAQDLGLNLETVTDAALGNKDALAEINTELERFANVDTPRGVDSEMFKQREEGAKLSKQLEDLAGDSDSAVASSRRLAEATDGASGAARRGRRSFEDQATALAKSRDAASQTASKFITLADSLNDSKVSLGQWIRDLQEQATALRNFRINAETAANKGLRQGLIAALQDAGPEGALRMKQLANATKSEIGKANAAWASGRREMQRYVDFKVPPKKIDVDTNPAKAAIRQIEAMLAGIPDAIHTNYYINTVRSAVKPEVHAPRAMGGPIVGPGTKTSDSVPLMASNGEFVMSAAAVDHYGLDTMFKMNARRLAGGGSVDGIKPQGTLDDRLAIASALQQIRDLAKQLNERVKKGKHKGDLVTTGIDRQVLELQLAAARMDLKAAQNREKREAREAARVARQEAREAKQAIAGTKAGLSLTGGLTSITPPSAGEQAAASVWSALRDFRDQIEDAGGHVGRNFDQLALKSGVLTARYEDNAAKIADLNSQIDSIRSGAAGSFMHDPFTGGLADFDLQVAADTNDSNGMIAALQKAAARGLDGPLAAALSQSGNLALAEEFAALSPAEIAARENAFTTRDTAGKALGDLAVQMSGLAQQVSQLTAQNVLLVGQISAMEAKIKDGVYQGAYDGTAQREHRRNQQVHGRVGSRP